MNNENFASLPESSPIAHLLTMVRPANSEARTRYLLQLCWDLAYSHGVKMTEQAHSILDEPEFKLTEIVEPKGMYIKAPHRTDLKPVVKSKYNYHYQQIRKIMGNVFNFVPVACEYRKFKLSK